VIGVAGFTGSGYETPDSLRELDDAIRVTGGLIGLGLTVSGIWFAFQKWRKRRRDKRNAEIREAMAELRAELKAQIDELKEQLGAIDDDVTEVKADVKDVQNCQVGHIDDHAKGRFRDR
jgi:DNA-binding transcriptional MerR regulator